MKRQVKFKKKNRKSGACSVIFRKWHSRGHWFCQDRLDFAAGTSLKDSKCHHWNSKVCSSLTLHVRRGLPGRPGLTAPTWPEHCRLPWQGREYSELQLLWKLPPRSDILSTYAHFIVQVSQSHWTQVDREVQCYHFPEKKGTSLSANRLMTTVNYSRGTEPTNQKPENLVRLLKYLCGLALAWAYETAKSESYREERRFCLMGSAGKTGLPFKGKTT